MIYYQNPPKFNVIYATRTARVGICVLPFRKMQKYPYSTHKRTCSVLTVRAYAYLFPLVEVSVSLKET